MFMALFLQVVFIQLIHKTLGFLLKNWYDAGFITL